MQERTLARRYAKGLLEAARDQNALDQVEQELALVGAALSGREAVRFLNNPCVSFAQKRKALQAALGRECSPLILDLLELLAQRRRMKAFPYVVTLFGELLDEFRQRVRAQVKLAAETPEAMLGALKARLSQALRKAIILEPQVDESLIGGAMLVVKDTEFDGSVKGAIKALHERMKQ